MFSARCFALTTALLSLIGSASTFDINGKTNVAIYYGQGPNEKYLGLKEFCKNSNVDIIPLGFLDIYLAQGNGYPGTNFASSCTGSTFNGPGYNGVDDPSLNDLQNDCPTLVDGIGYCQQHGKKILLSLGGAPGSTDYQLTSTADAENMADFLWGAFGPKQNPNKWPRPFDDAATGTHSVDGFDFDIEVIQPGEQQYYITMITRLMSHFPTGPGAKKYLITGAPQCIVPDSNMGDMITGVPFDILFLQYYNTDSCSAREWVTANPKFPSVPENPSGFGYEFSQLLSFLEGGASKNAKIYFGLPGAPAAANADEYLDVTEATHFLEAYFCQPRFGGVMIWEGIYAYNNTINGKNYQNTMKDLLTTDSKNATLKKCPTATPTYSTSSPTATAACCTNPYTVVSGDTCFAIYTKYSLTSAQFYALNPSLNNGANCPFLQVGQVLCLARASSTTAVCSVTSTTTTTSATSTPTSCVSCTETYTVVSGDYCYLIYTNAGISSTTFYALNPSLDNGNNCGDLQIGQVLCIAGTTGSCTTSTTSSTSSTTTTSATATPTSCVSCTETYTVVSGDYCYLIYTNAGISSITFYALNPSLDNGNNCGDLQIGQVLCIAGTAGSCTTSTTSSTSSTTSSTSSSSTTSSTSSSSSSSTSSTTTSSSSSSSSSTTSTTSTTSSSSSSSSSTTSSNTTSSSTSQMTSSSSTTTTTSNSSSTSSTSMTSSSSSSNSTSSSISIANMTSSSTSPSTSSSRSSSKSYTSFSNSTSSTLPTTSPITYTTTTTSVYTVTSCPPTVTNCPTGHVTTDIITITTTYCPANATSSPTTTSSPVQYTTSVVYTTLTYTITACPATVTNCPASGSVITETRVLYTTICPVTALTTPVIVPTSTAPGAPAKEVSAPVMSISPSTSLSFSPVTYPTVTAPKSSSSSSSFAVVYQTMSVIPVASTSPSNAVVASASPVKPGAATFTGAAANTASFGAGGIMAVVLYIFGWALM